MSAGWAPGIGDPTVLGWTVVAAYVGAATLALMVACQRSHPAQVRVFWISVWVLLAALAVNKQSDLQSALTQAGRCLARAQGWYGERRVVQLAFVVAVIAAGVTAALASLVFMRRHLRRVGVAMLGMWTVLVYVTIRAAGFHHFERMVATPIAGVRANPLLELAGIALVLVNAAWVLARHLRPPGSSARDR